MHLDEPDDPDDGDFGDFGPGTDLVLSLVAVAVLMLGVVGVGRRDQPPPPSPPCEGCGDIQTTQLPRDTFVGRLAIDLRDAKNISFFREDSSVLTDQAIELISASTAAMPEIVKDVGGNHLLVVGYASATPRNRSDGADGNLDLSAFRALAVAHQLNRLGLPYKCISVLAHGRGRSPLLHDTFYSLYPDETVEKWDQLFTLENGIERFLSNQRIGASLEEERRVSAMIVYDQASKCVEQDFFAAFR